MLQPASLRDEAVQVQLQGFAPDVMVVAAYGLIVPQRLLDIPRLGAINVHASLLPRWRGAAPIQRALLAGDAQTGISIMQMDAGLDTGPLLMQESIPIRDDDTAGTLHDRLATLGADICVRALDALEDGLLVPAAQDPELATYANKIEKSEARIDWGQSAQDVCRRVRAFNPYPGASSSVRGTEVKIWRCTVLEASGMPGEVLGISDNGLTVACGEHAILATQLQRAGNRRLAAADFLRGFSISRGDRFVTEQAP